MTEPVTELTLESPAGLIRVTADCADGKVRGVTFRNVPAFATHLDTAGRGAPPGHGHRRRRLRRDVLRHRLRRGVRAPAHPGRGRRHRPDQRDDQGGRRRAAAGRPPRPARVRRHHHRPAVRPGARPGQQPAERGDRLDREAGLGAAGDLDRRHRPLTVRDRDLGPDGDAPRQGPARVSATRSATRASSGRSSPAASSRRRRSGRTGRSCRASPARPGSPASRATSSTRPTRSPTASRSATSGPRPARARTSGDRAPETADRARDA